MTLTSGNGYTGTGTGTDAVPVPVPGGSGTGTGTNANLRVRVGYEFCCTRTTLVGGNKTSHIWVAYYTGFIGNATAVVS